MDGNTFRVFSFGASDATRRSLRVIGGAVERIIIGDLWLLGNPQFQSFARVANSRPAGFRIGPRVSDSVLFWFPNRSPWVSDSKPGFRFAFCWFPIRLSLGFRFVSWRFPIRFRWFPTRLRWFPIRGFRLAPLPHLRGGAVAPHTPP